MPGLYFRSDNIGVDRQPVEKLDVNGIIKSNTGIKLEDPGAGTNEITLRAPTLASSYILTLPSTTGSSGQILTSGGPGVLSWSTQVIGDFVLKAGDTMSGNLTITIPSGGNAVGETINQNDTVNNPRALQLINAGTGNTLFVDPNGNASSSTSTGGAILLENTGNSGAGLVIYSNHPTATGRLLSVRADNVGYATQPVYIENDGTSHGVTIVHNSTGTNALGLNIVSVNPNDTALGISGRESGRGTIKSTHNKPDGVADTNASAISLLLDRVNVAETSAAQGIFLDTTHQTTGKLLNIRNNGVEQLVLQPDGKVELLGTAPNIQIGNAGEIRLRELTTNGVNYVGFKAADNLTSNTTWTLPTADGTSGQVLTTNGVGNLSFVNATRTIILTAGGSWPSTTSGATAPAKVETTTNRQNLQLVDFADGSTQYIEWTIVMPDNYNGGTVTAKFYWTCATASTNAVVWGIQGRAYNNGDAIDQAWGTAQTVTSAGNASANVIITSASTPAITFAGTPQASSVIQIRAYREGANAADTLTATARLVSVMLKYTTNQFSD